MPRGWFGHALEHSWAAQVGANTRKSNALAEFKRQLFAANERRERKRARKEARRQQVIKPTIKRRMRDSYHRRRGRTR